MDGQHKQRWVGVILLLLLAAMLAPFVFREPEQMRLSLEMEVPQPPPVAAVKPAASRDQQKVERARKQIRRERTAAEASSRDAAGAPGKAPPLSGWAVQVGSFRQSDNARRLEQSLRDAGYNAYWREVTGQQGKPLFRVFIGPELKRADARALRERVAADKGFDLDGLVVPYTP